MKTGSTIVTVVLRNALIGLAATIFSLPLVRAQDPISPSVDRSPVDIAIGEQGRLLATANQTSSSVSLVDLASGKVIDERRVGEHPEFIAFAPDGKTLIDQH